MQIMKRRGGSPRAVQDIAGGLLLGAIGVVALVLVKNLPASGPSGFAAGTAPRLTAYAVIALGALISIGGWLREGGAIEGFGWRGIVAILGSVLIFAVSIEPLGLIATGVPLVVLASAAAQDFRWKESLIFACAITVFCVLLFAVALGQSIPLEPKHYNLPSLAGFAAIAGITALVAVIFSRRDRM